MHQNKGAAKGQQQSTHRWKHPRDTIEMPQIDRRAADKKLQRAECCPLVNRSAARGSP